MRWDDLRWEQPEVRHNKPTKWNWVVAHPEGFSLGKNTDIGAYTYINCNFGVTIEEDVQIGSHCSIYSHNTIENKQGRVIIKKGTKIGTHCTIMQGVTIGKNCIIGAYSFVNRDVPDNTKAYGIPIKF